MTRTGFTKVRTGCVTCKVRRIKCDEAHPECRRCKSTGRSCGGYDKVPKGNASYPYSWEELLCDPGHRPQRQALAAIPGATPTELRNIAFFQHVVAPSLSGPLESSFWTCVVAQAAYVEPAVRHAILATSVLYQAQSISQTPHSSRESSQDDFNALAIRFYNTAIRNLVCLSPTASNRLDTVLIVCIIFVGIELLRGNIQAASTHVTHGFSLLRSSHEPVRSELVSVLKNIGTLPVFFAKDLPDLQLPAESESKHRGSSFADLSQAQDRLDEILLQGARLVRVANQHHIGVSDPLPFDVIQQSQKPLDAELDEWWSGFACLRDTLRAPRPQHKAVLLFSEMRWLNAKIYVATCLHREETIWNSHLEEFGRIIALGQQFQALKVSRVNRSRYFSLTTGFCPLFFWVAHRCRHLKLRVAALGLLKSLAWEREMTWDRALFLAVGKRIIELEHEMELTPSEVIKLQKTKDEQTLAPSRVRWRVRDITLYNPDTETADGSRKIGFLMQSCGDGNETLVDDWLTVA